MSVFLLIVFSVFVGNLLWWWWADRRLRPLRRAALWRFALALFMGLQVGYLVWAMSFPTAGRRAHQWLPAPILSAIYLWHLLALPVAMLIMLGDALRRLPRAAVRWFYRRDRIISGPDDAGPTRRQLLAAATVALPPVLLGGGIGVAMTQLGLFRIRRLHLIIPSLPRDLDGITIAHVSDIHVGRFTRPRMLPGIAQAVNDLRADLVLLTGDLIDLSLSDLPVALDMVKQLDPRQGLAMVEGNHDLIDDRFAFEQIVKTSGVPLLLGESMTVRLRGRSVQLMGLPWARGDEKIAESVQAVATQRQNDAFPILLAHHPHAFDAAADAGFPLVLAGHTHGGQLMLNERMGAGPVLFRYYSGLYHRHQSQLVVSHGVGNWFPLRLNAPAEIIHLTLHPTT